VYRLSLSPWWRLLRSSIPTTGAVAAVRSPPAGCSTDGVTSLRYKLRRPALYMREAPRRQCKGGAGGGIADIGFNRAAAPSACCDFRRSRCAADRSFAASRLGLRGFDPASRRCRHGSFASRLLRRRCPLGDGVGRGRHGLRRSDAVGMVEAQTPGAAARKLGGASRIAWGPFGLGLGGGVEPQATRTAAGEARGRARGPLSGYARSLTPRRPACRRDRQADGSAAGAGRPDSHRGHRP